MKPSRIFALLGALLLITSLFGPGTQTASAGGGGLVFTVNSTGDDIDGNPGNGVCQIWADGPCTLRAAIQEANAVPGDNTIWFDIPGSGVRVISPGTELPPITEQIDLDASLQSNCTVPCIAISGASIAGTPDGLVLNANNSRIKGLVIVSFSNFGMIVQGDANNIEKNFVGVWPSTSAVMPNGTGMLITGSYNTIGGTIANERNVISGNTDDGIVVGNNADPIAYNNYIQGNYIGTNAAGTAARSNGRFGVLLMTDAVNTLIGGAIKAERNVISGNQFTGIEISGDNNLIEGNYIGTRADGRGSIGNGGYGIRFMSGASANAAGFTISGSGNRIAHNGSGGIMLIGGTVATNSVMRNSIFANSGLGIDLGDDGVTLNDFMDGDGGPNMLQNFPVVKSAYSATRVIKAVLHSTPGAQYRIEFFSSPPGSCDPTKYGEGRTFLGAKTVTTNVNGNAAFSFTSPKFFGVGSLITVTATDNNGRTSEFSHCKAAG